MNSILSDVKSARMIYINLNVEIKKYHTEAAYADFDRGETKFEYNLVRKRYTSRQ